MFLEKQRKRDSGGKKLQQHKKATWRFKLIFGVLEGCTSKTSKNSYRWILRC